LINYGLHWAVKSPGRLSLGAGRFTSGATHEGLRHVTPYSFDRWMQQKEKKKRKNLEMAMSQKDEAAATP
jgi:hypothetical protein